MQIITIAGYLSRDAEQRTTQQGDSVTSLNIPVKQGWGEREQTNWYRVNVWGKRADFAGKFRKGDFLTVTGELTIGEYNSKPQYEVRAHDFQSVNMNKGDRVPDGSQGHSQTSAADDLNDEIPFATNASIW